MHQWHDIDTELDLYEITSGFHGAFATDVACQQGILTFPDTWFRPPFLLKNGKFARNMGIKIVTLVVKGSVKLTVPTDWQEHIQEGSRSVALCCVCDLKLRGVRLTEIILKVWVINGQYVLDISICEVELKLAIESSIRFIHFGITGVVCRQGTLTPQDTWPLLIRDLHMFYLLRWPILFPNLSLFLRTMHFELSSILSQFGHISAM